MAFSTRSEVLFDTFSNVIDGTLRFSEHYAQGIDPNTNHPNWDVPIASTKDVDEAVDAANRAYINWKVTTWADRCERINKFKATLEAYG